MPDKFSPVEIDVLFTWILDELKFRNQIFGIPKEQFFLPQKNNILKTTKYSQLLETPIGVAAGPHTQMAQNIISAWLCGARFIELKTVQTLDELKISRPCIDMEDEGYNCEWSQELKLNESFNEYLKAYIIILILKDILKIENQENQPGFIFNLSIGYDFKGILQDNMQKFLDNCKNIKPHTEKFLYKINKIYPKVKNINFLDKLSNNITLSTMHGCPPEEIEQIGLYLIEQLGLNTTIKLNPTLLGYEEVRNILNNLGFSNIELKKDSFEHDLNFDTAIKIVKKLKFISEKKNLEFGIKLTNTLACINNKDIFSKNEPMMYMSGRALHPIGINLANKIFNTLNGDIKISFTGGVNTFNISDVISCNLIPATVCSDILKPGGYQRLTQYLETLTLEFKKLNVTSIENFIIKTSKLKNVSLKDAISKNLFIYSKKVLENEDYYRETYPYKSIKIKSKKLRPFDCINAPCITTCPTNQNVPCYIFLAKQKKFDKALEIIKQDNPMPKVCGNICVRTCETKCTRINYDYPIMIRDMKKFISERSQVIHKKLNIKNNTKIAIIGSGPAGLSAAYYLTLANFKVTIFESKKNVGGVVSNIIPNFRISKNVVNDDIRKIISLGVKVCYNQTFGKDFNIKKLKKENFKYIFIATGLPKGKKLNIENENAKNVFDCLSFLSQVKSKLINLSYLGTEVIVIGGGNSAIDAARTSKKFLKNSGTVTVVYRRTKDLMPADTKEIKEMLDEGVKLVELAAPKRILIKDGSVKGLECIKMGLSEKDDSGRRKPVEIQGTEFVLRCSSIIVAIGQDNNSTIFSNSGIAISKNGLIVTNEKLETNIENIFAGGDIVRGANSIIQSIADGKKVAFEIIKKEKIKNFNKIYGNKIRINIPIKKLLLKKSLRIKPTYSKLDSKNYVKETDRCLNCDLLCNICVTVCPNRANQYYETKKQIFYIKKVVITNNKPQILDDKKFILSQQVQILNIGDFCNECGNCNTFCPSDNAPYKIKPKLYLTKSEFDLNQNNVFYYKKNVSGDSCLQAKFDGKTYSLTKKDKIWDYETEELKVEFLQNMKIKNLVLKSNISNNTTISLEPAIQMFIILKYGIKSLSFIFNQQR